MQRENKYLKRTNRRWSSYWDVKRGYIFAAGLLFFNLMGCAGENGRTTARQPENAQTEASVTETLQTEEPLTEVISQAKELTETETDEPGENPNEPAENKADWSDYFGGLNGAAVIYDATEHCFWTYNQELAETRRSPCSTFKIISSLIGLETGIIRADDSVRPWNGEIFWNEQWNRDLNFSDAFHASCVWYFREVIDDIGRDTIQEELHRLQYGNCDISDWEGHLNTNNQNPALTGFWIESSLLISPKEQVNVMEIIFGDKTAYSEETLQQLKQVMLLQEEEEADISVYGKTGMGKAHGIVVDAWFTGFAENGGKRISFCVYLGETDDPNVSSATAREIAVNIVSDYLKEKQPL